MTAVESLADFIIPKAAVNPAAHSHPSDCPCVRLHERIRELEAERDSMFAAVQEERKETHAAMEIIEPERARAERAEARLHERIRELETELAAVRKAEKEWHADEECLRNEFEARAQCAEGNFREQALEMMKIDMIRQKAEAAARTEATAAQIHFEARQRLEARVKEADAVIAKLSEGGVNWIDGAYRGFHLQKALHARESRIPLDSKE